jgi:hypothetical protein
MNLMECDHLEWAQYVSLLVFLEIVCVYNATLLEALDQLLMRAVWGLIHS